MCEVLRICQRLYEINVTAMVIAVIYIYICDGYSLVYTEKHFFINNKEKILRDTL